MHLQYITDENGQKLSVVLPVKEYEKQMEGLEDMEDELLYDEAKKSDGPAMPFEQYLEERKKRKNG